MGLLWNFDTARASTVSVLSIAVMRGSRKKFRGVFQRICVCQGGPIIFSIILLCKINKISSGTPPRHPLDPRMMAVHTYITKDERNDDDATCICVFKVKGLRLAFLFRKQCYYFSNCSFLLISNEIFKQKKRE